jgi:hypothetical protein
LIRRLDRILRQTDAREILIPDFNRTTIKARDRITGVDFSLGDFSLYQASSGNIGLINGHFAAGQASNYKARLIYFKI